MWGKNFVWLIKRFALITQWAHYRLSDVGGQGSTHCEVFFSAVNGNSRLCVKFVPRSKEFVNCIAHISSALIKHSFTLQCMHECLSSPLPVMTCLIRFRKLSVCNIVYSAGDELWEWNRRQSALLLIVYSLMVIYFNAEFTVWKVSRPIHITYKVILFFLYCNCQRHGYFKHVWNCKATFRSH